LTEREQYDPSRSLAAKPPAEHGGKVCDPSQDDIDTSPIVFRDGARAEFGSTTVQPGESAEIVLAPEDAMHEPILFVSVNPRDGVVEIASAICGKKSLVVGRVPAESLKFGHPTETLVSRVCPVEIAFVNNDLRPVRIGASLVASDETVERK
jgi:hypothetical protein